MKSHTITFRLSKYHLARGLKVIRNIEPGYQLTSLNDIVKVIYHDYLAKMTLGTDDSVESEDLLEIELFASGGRKIPLTLESVLDQLAERPSKAGNLNKTPAAADPASSEESEISSVSDFSPPDDWME